MTESTAYGRRGSAAAFFALTFAFSWLIWVPLALSHFGVGPLAIPRATSEVVRLLGVIGPALIAFVCAVVFGGRRDLKDLLRLTLRWRVGAMWWLLAAFLFPGILLAAAGLHSLLGRTPPLTPVTWASPDMLVVTLVILAIASAGEEVGWRGYALPRLQGRYSALTASLVLGTIWTIWHLPFWLLQDVLAIFGPGYLVLDWLAFLPIAILITWIVNNGRGSALLAWVFHFTGNIVNVAYMLVTSNVEAFVIVAGLSWILAVAVVVYYGPERLVREKQTLASAPAGSHGVSGNHLG